jgi:g-D-glutamyl-meso-diaminopimelate peptidase
VLSYGDLLTEVEALSAAGVETGVVGESVLHQRIPYVFVGKKTGNYMIVQYAIHAREHITSLLGLCQIKHLLANPKLRLDGGIYFLPMMNPDGVRLCCEGVGFVGDKNVKNRLLTINNYRSDFSLWKANANGVDLNVNFDADWGQGEQNMFYKSAQNYIGRCPESEAETKALVEFTRRIKPVVTLSYHCKGEVIYWRFGQNEERLVRDKMFADALSKYTGYELIDGTGSVGGYKDWCIDSLGIPSFTIEVGGDNYEHPFPYEQFEVILQQNVDLPRRLLNSVVKYNGGV